MKGLSSTSHNTLNRYKATISIKRKDVLQESKDTAALLSTSTGTTVAPEITTNSNAQDGADCQNTFRLAAVGVKEGIAEGITTLVGKDITNPSSEHRTAATSNQSAITNSINSSLPLGKVQNALRQPTSENNSSTSHERYLIGGKPSRQTLSDS